MALMIEVMSIQVAGKQIKKPIDIPRPGKKGKGGDRQQEQRQQPGGALRTPAQPPSRRQAQAPAASQDAGIKHAIGVFQRTSKARR